MAAIANDWLAPMSGEFKKPYYRKLYETVKNEYGQRRSTRRRMTSSTRSRSRLSPK